MLELIIGLDITNIIHYLNLPTGTYYFFINKKNTSIYDFFAGNQWSHYQQKLVKKIGLWIAINLKYVNAKTRGSASKKKKVNGWDQHKPFSEIRVYKICIESLLFIY